MLWARMVAYVTGTVNQELPLRNEYLGAENRTPVVVRFKLGSIKGSKKSGFGPYATPPKRLRIFEFLVRDQEDGGSNPLAPTNSFGTDNLQHAKDRKTAWCRARKS
jgi:hypothetical protein